MVGVGLGVAAQDQSAAIGSRKLYIEHLHGGKLIEHGSRCQPTCHRAQSRPQRDVQAIGHEGDKDMRFDSVLELVADRA